MTFKKSENIKEFREIEGKRVGELNPPQLDLAYEKWLRDQFDWLRGQHQDHAERLLRIIDDLRDENNRLKSTCLDQGINAFAIRKGQPDGQGHDGEWVVRDAEIVETTTDKVIGGFDSDGNLRDMELPAKFRIAAKTEAARERLIGAKESGEIVSISGLSCVITGLDRNHFLAQEVRPVHFPER